MECYKKGYESEKQAKSVLNSAKKHGRRKIPKYCYKCPYCGKRHLTTHVNDWKIK